MKRTILSLILLSIAPTQGSLGLKVKPNSIPKGLCRITLTNTKTSENFHCTGSVIGKHTIKTAGHCLHSSKVQKVECIGRKKVSYLSVKRHPQYNHRILQREIENRFQDQALITTKEDLSDISFIPLTNSSSIKIENFEQCLIAGFGQQEISRSQTGFLSGSLIPGFKDKIELGHDIIKVHGAYLVELLPGDSGGPLLCYQDHLWFDLGTASAHTWDYESIYSANANLDFDSSELTQVRRGHSTAAKAQESRIAQEPKYLRPYSKVQAEDGRSFFNGDLTFVELSIVDDSDPKYVKAKIQVGGASSNYLCSEPFLCYGDSKEVLVRKEDLLDKPHSFNSLYDPFAK